MLSGEMLRLVAGSGYRRRIDEPHPLKVSFCRAELIDFIKLH